MKKRSPGSPDVLSKADHPLRVQLSKKSAQGKNQHYRIIIQLNAKPNTKSVKVLQKHVHPHSLKVDRRLPLIRAVSASVSAKCIYKLCGCGDVAAVYLDRVRQTRLQYATPSIGSDLARKAGLTGKGIGIAVLDTGVYPHPDLTLPKKRIIAFQDLIAGRRNPYDDNGHGTHVAGDAAGNGRQSGGRYRGPAPEAAIIGVKVLDSSGSGFDSTIIQGIQWCIDHKKELGIRLIVLSLGGPALTPPSRDPLCQAVRRATQAGIAVFAAAGNSGPGKGTIESPGIEPSAVTIGAADDHRTISPADDTIAAFSGRGPATGGGSKPDLVAPGVGIVSLRAPRSQLDRLLPGSRVGTYYFRLSGTSMSTPLAAGAAAQLLQKRPELTPAALKRLMKQRAFNLRESAAAQGSGEVNVGFAAPKTKQCTSRTAKLRAGIRR
ncbi:S8 family serine peptidase [Paenibacillus lutrae]|uniref:S8 family serine peptidase n=1 Tax=Paenibacillus lutrae TaxID=2078573 RepID=UPI0012FC3CC5